MKTKLTLFFIHSFFYILSTTVAFAEGIKLGGYPFPTTTASFTATEVVANIQFNELTYTDNLMYDYNLANGFYRPYRWPEGTKDTETYLEFTLTPLNGATVTASSIQIVNRPNTVRLGPTKFSVSYSIDAGENFTNMPEISIASRTLLLKDIIGFETLTTTQPILFRIYAYESLYGSVSEKDAWTIDYIEVFGSVQEDVSTSIIDSSKQKQVKSYYTDGKLHITGVTESTKLTVCNMFGKKLYVENISADKSISLDYPDQLLIVKMESERKRWTTKILTN